jgi:hypothetical protein
MQQVIRVQLKGEPRRTASNDLTFPHPKYVTYCMLRVEVANDLLQITHMLDTWWTDYWLLFEVLVWKLPILRGKFNGSCMTRLTVAHTVHCIVLGTESRLMCCNAREARNVHLFCSWIGSTVYMYFLTVETYRYGRNRTISVVESLEYRFTVFSSFEIKHVWELEVISNTYSNMPQIILIYILCSVQKRKAVKPCRASEVVFHLNSLYKYEPQEYL